MSGTGRAAPKFHLGARRDRSSHPRATAEGRSERMTDTETAIQCPFATSSCCFPSFAQRDYPVDRGRNFSADSVSEVLAHAAAAFM